MFLEIFSGNFSLNINSQKSTTVSPTQPNNFDNNFEYLFLVIVVIVFWNGPSLHLIWFVTCFNWIILWNSKMLETYFYFFVIVILCAKSPPLSQSLFFLRELLKLHNSGFCDLKKKHVSWLFFFTVCVLLETGLYNASKSLYDPIMACGGIILYFATITFIIRNWNNMIL